MVYVDISAETWIGFHPNLKVTETSCAVCGDQLRANQPYWDPPYVGLVSDPCGCPRLKKTCSIETTSCPAEVAEWSDLFGKLKSKR